jgi:hypothetical protein
VVKGGTYCRYTNEVANNYYIYVAVFEYWNSGSPFQLIQVIRTPYVRDIEVFAIEQDTFLIAALFDFTMLNVDNFQRMYKFDASKTFQGMFDPRTFEPTLPRAKGLFEAYDFGQAQAQIPNSGNSMHYTDWQHIQMEDGRHFLAVGM